MLLLNSLFFLISSSTKYAIMVDCGSSGTRVHLYYWDKTQDVPKIRSPDPQTESNFVVDVKLSSAANNDTIISIIGNSIISRCTPLIPFKKISSTDVFIYATAGLRLLPADVQNTIMKKMYRYIREHSQFRVRQNMIRVITGAEEGVFGWLSVNYLLNKLDQNSNSSSSMSIDMGGASTEIAFEIGEGESDQNNYIIRVGRRGLNVFSYSYLYYGTDSAHNSVNSYFLSKSKTNEEPISNPCYFKGFTIDFNNHKFIGTGDFDQCLDAIQKVLIEAPNFTDISIPSIDKIKNVHAISTFAYVISFLNISSHTTLNEYYKTFSKLSQLTMDQIYKKYEASGISKKFLPEYFWEASYGYAFLAKGLKMTDEIHTFDMPYDIDGNDLGWALGAMIKEVYDVQVRDNRKPYLTTIFIINGILFIIFYILFALYLITRNKNNDDNSRLPLIAL